MAVATVPAAGAVAQPIPDVKLIDDHLAVQAIIRAYQVRSVFFVLLLGLTATFAVMPFCRACHYVHMKCISVIRCHYNVSDDVCNPCNS